MSQEKMNNTEEIKEETTVSDTQNAENTDKKSDKKDKRSIKVLEKMLEDAQKDKDTLVKEKEALNDTYLRMLAEYDNFRKRVTKEKETLYSDGIADAIEKLLPMLDNLDRAVATEVSSQDAIGVLEGVNKILTQAKEIFEKLGVSEIPALGEKFNPELHNAVMHEDDPEKDENIISDVFLKGYKLGEKVIRHSVVKVLN